MSDFLSKAIAEGEAIDGRISKALSWLKNDPLAADAIKAIPALAPIASKLIGIIPIVGEVEDGLAFAGALIALEQSGIAKPMDANDIARIRNEDQFSA